MSEIAKEVQCIEEMDVADLPTLTKYCMECGTKVVLTYNEDESCPNVPVLTGVCSGCDEKVSYGPYPGSKEWPYVSADWIGRRFEERVADLTTNEEG